MTILIGALVGILVAVVGGGLYNYFTYFPGKNPSLFVFNEKGSVNFYKGYSTRVKYAPFKSRVFFGKLGMASYAKQMKTPEDVEPSTFPFKTDHKGICGSDHLQSMFVMVAFDGSKDKPQQKILSYDLKCSVDGVDMKRLFFKVRDDLKDDVKNSALQKKVKDAALEEYETKFSKCKYISRKSWNSWVNNDLIYCEPNQITVKASTNAKELFVCQKGADSEKLISMSNEEFDTYLAKNNIFSEFL